MKPHPPVVTAICRGRSPWSSMNSGSTQRSDAPPVKEYPMGVRDPSLGEHKSKNSDAGEDEEGERPYFFRSFQPIYEDDVISNKLLIALLESITLCLNRTFNVRYSSPFLDLDSKQTYCALLESAENTQKMLHFFRSRLSTQVTEIAILGHLLIQHRVMILYEYDDAQRKVHAKESFPDDIVGKWSSPTGDLLLLPRASPKSGFSLVMCLEDAVRVWFDTGKLPGSYRGRLIPRCQLHMEFGVIPLKDNIIANKALRLSLQFKPVFFPVYFEAEDRRNISPKQVMALKLLEKICLATEHLCDSALVCKQIGSAFLLAQRAKMCCVMMDLILETSLLADHRCYTHLVANWQLGNAAYLCSFHANTTLPELVRQYEVMTSTFRIFSLLDDTLKKEFDQELWSEKIGRLLQPADAWAKRLEAGLRAFQELRPPGRWTRSHFRAHALAVLLDWHRVSQWTEHVSLVRVVSMPFQIYVEAESSIPSDCAVSPLRDMAVLGRLVEARAHRYRANAFDAEILLFSDESESESQEAIYLPLVPEAMKARNSSWGEMFVSLGSAARCLQCAAAAGGKFWLRAFMRVVLERSSALLAKVHNTINCMKCPDTETPAAMVEDVVHSLCSITSLCSKVLRSLKTDNRQVYEALHSSCVTVVSLHCSALSRVFLQWYRSATYILEAVESQRLLLAARYYHALTMLGIIKGNVALAILNHHVTELQLAEAVFGQSLGQESSTYLKDIRRRVHILRRCVDLLPFLWERTILTSTVGPTHCWHPDEDEEFRVSGPPHERKVMQARRPDPPPHRSISGTADSPCQGTNQRSNPSMAG